MNISTCPRCDMSFKSLLLLEKHKEKFCIGSARPMRESETPKDLAERLNGRMRHHLEHRRHLETEAQRKTEPQTEFKLRREPTGSTAKPLTMDGHNSQISGLAMHHDKKLADLSNATKQLQKKHREIDAKLLEMATQGKAVSEMERMLQNLKAQEERNTQLLEAMMTQLLTLQADPRQQPTQGHKQQQQQQREASQSRQNDAQERGAQTFVPLYMGGLLSSEISNVRLSYLQHGGRSPQVLAQLQELLNEALQVEMHHGKQPNPKTHQREPSKRRYDSDWYQINKQLITTEIENQKLEEELRTAQLRKSKGSRPPYSTHMGPLRGQEVQAMKMDIDLLKHELEINRLRRQIRTRRTPQSPSLFPSLEEVRSQTPALTKYLYEQTDALGPASYDPVAGFVVFYDFLLGLSLSYRLCRLTVGLFSGDQELGAPSLLPPVQCELSSPCHPPGQHRGQLAVLATKQAVPRVHPAPALSLVLHLQASGGYDTLGQEVTRLLSRGWVKVDVFDQHNRVISGRWRVPLRLLPTKPSMTTGEMNAVPQLDSAELYLRVVNARDADAHSSIPISQSMASLYRFPPVVTTSRRLPSQYASESCDRSNKTHQYPSEPAPPTNTLSGDHGDLAAPPTKTLSGDLAAPPTNMLSGDLDQCFSTLFVPRHTFDT
ncbi:coiled-coil domain-containing protein 17-like [Alosa alosa]|uniref:coiled-coil domain-containing protein 17-like n=1 Tax=Alosa alosa TaxID=278164 RepID=UPI002015235A|nr:coiled-coil domain-containing protein 17-like [Alosa alosa]